VRSASFQQAGVITHVIGGITVTKTTQTVESAGGTFPIKHVFPPGGGRRMLTETAAHYRGLA